VTGSITARSWVLAMKAVLFNDNLASVKLE